MAASARIIAPHPGPQTDFAGATTDIAFLGGAAGGGKSHALIREGAVGVHLPGYEGVLFRRESPQLTDLWNKARLIYPIFGGREREHPHKDFRFPSGALLQFRHLQYDKDAWDYDGRELAFIGFDELHHFTAAQFWYLVSRNRSSCGMRPYVRATLNPDSEHWTRDFLGYYIGSDGYVIAERSGKVRWFVRRDDEVHWADSRLELLLRFPTSSPLSFTFILARKSDNPTVDPGYDARLDNLDRVQRLRLRGELDEHGRDRGGSWNARPGAGLYFRREWFKLVDGPPGRIVKSVRGWDKAATEESEESPDPDWTEGARVHLLDSGDWYIDDLRWMRGSPGAVLAFMRRTAELDERRVHVACWRDVAQAGKVDQETTQNALHGFVVRFIRSAKNKLAYAEAWSARAEPRPGSLHGRIYLRRAPWNERLFTQAEAFPGGGHDDAIDAISVAFQFLKPGASSLNDGHDEDLPSLRY